MQDMIQAQKEETIEDLLNKIKVYDPEADLDIVRLAYDFAANAHEGQFRKSGEPYITHPLAAAHILANMRIDPVIITATLLHDVPEDTPVTLDDPALVLRRGLERLLDRHHLLP